MAEPKYTPGSPDEEQKERRPSGVVRKARRRDDTPQLVRLPLGVSDVDVITNPAPLAPPAVRTVTPEPAPLPISRPVPFPPGGPDARSKPSKSAEAIALAALVLLVGAMITATWLVMLN